MMRKAIIMTGIVVVAVLALAEVAEACGCGGSSCGVKAKAKQVTAKTQTACAICGAPADKSVHVEHDGKKLHFCGQGCASRFKEDPVRHIQKREQTSTDKQSEEGGLSIRSAVSRVVGWRAGRRTCPPLYAPMKVCGTGSRLIG